MRGGTKRMKSEIKKARALRRNETEAEKYFWSKVKDRQQGYKFYRQMPVKDYIADFLCSELKLIVEIDGGQHNGSLTDEARTDVLNKAGYKVLRFWNNDVLDNMDGVLTALAEEIAARKVELSRPWI